MSLEEPKVTEYISEDDLKDFIPVLLFHNIDKGDFSYARKEPKSQNV